MRRLLLVFLAVVAVACGDAHRTPSKPVKSATSEQLHAVAEKPAKSRTAQCLDSLGYENIAERDTSIAIDLMYARADNFVGRVLYADLREAYLHPVAMECLLKAQRLLRKKHPEYRLIVYDAARPMSVQQQMWDVVKGSSKSRYVSNPAHGGGLHNYGLAVDISIADSLGRPLPMGTAVDHLGSEAGITHEAALVEQGKITAQERANRQLLRSVMKEAGFRINWIMPSRPASIDCFRINLTEYVNGTPTCMTLYTDGSEDSFYDFGEAKSGATYSYTIQTVRLNRMSDESNVITVDPAGVNGIEATEPLAVLPIGNGIYFRCAVAHTNVRIIDMTGRVIKVIDSVSEGHCELLPYGAYMVYSDQCRRPIKVLVKD